jgi:hypothetical protein
MFNDKYLRCQNVTHTGTQNNSNACAVESVHKVHIFTAHVFNIYFNIILQSQRIIQVSFTDITLKPKI